MAERRIKKKYRSVDKANTFEFVAETSAYYATEYILLSESNILMEVNPLYALAAKIMGTKRQWSLVVPVVYYATKDLLLPEIVEKVVYYLAESSLGRLIIRKLAKIERQKAVMIALNIFIIVTLQNALGAGIDLVQIILLLGLEIGTDLASDRLL